MGPPFTHHPKTGRIPVYLWVRQVPQVPPFPPSVGAAPLGQLPALSALPTSRHSWTCEGVTADPRPASVCSGEKAATRARRKAAWFSFTGNSNPATGYNLLAHFPLRQQGVRHYCPTLQRNLTQRHPALKGCVRIVVKSHWMCLVGFGERSVMLGNESKGIYQRFDGFPVGRLKPLLPPSPARGQRFSV